MVLSVGQKQYTRAIKEVKKKEEKDKKWRYRDRRKRKGRRETSFSI
jgi:hypothetical protein